MLLSTRAPVGYIAIAKILSDLDAKIELNHQMNKTLEKIAHAIFKHWFIDFEFPNEEGKPYKSSGGKMVESELGPIPKNWYIGRLSDIAEITMGMSPPGTTYNEVGDGMPFFQGRRDFGFRYPQERVYCTDPKRMAEKDDILLSVRAPVGIIQNRSLSQIRDSLLPRLMSGKIRVNYDKTAPQG